jgi:hypothetical protein
VAEPEPSRAPATPQPPRRTPTLEQAKRPARERTSSRPRPALVAVLGVLAAGAALLIGLLVGGGPSDAESGGPEMTAGPATIRAPANWKADATALDVPGLALREARGATGPGSERLAAGVTSGSGATLLPAAFVRSLKSTPKRDDRVTLGGVQAYRFRDVRPGGAGEPLTLFAVPTADGVITIVCSAPDDAGRERCERAAGTLQVDERTTTLPLGPRADYADAVGGALARLARERRAPLARLRAARTSAGQSAATDALRGAYRRAAQASARVRPGPLETRAHQDLVRALDRAADGYAALSKSARSENAGAYGAARAAVAKRERALQRAQEALGNLGYLLG